PGAAPNERNSSGRPLRTTINCRNLPSSSGAPTPADVPWGEACLAPPMPGAVSRSTSRGGTIVPVAAHASLARCVPRMGRLAWSAWHGELSIQARGAGANDPCSHGRAGRPAHAHRSAEDLMSASEAGVDTKLLSWPGCWLVHPFGRWHRCLALGVGA